MYSEKQYHEDDSFQSEDCYGEGTSSEDFLDENGGLFGFQIIRKNVWSTYFGPDWREEQTDDKGIFLVRGLYGKSGKLQRIFALLTEGFGNRAIASIACASKNTVLKHRAVLEKLLGTTFKCPCGQLATHQGWCDIRMERSEARKAYLAKLGKKL